MNSPMGREVLPELRHLSVTHQRPSLLGKEVTLVPALRTVPSSAPSDSGTLLCPGTPRPTQLRRAFPMSFPHWCPWHIFSEAGVYPEALKSTQKPLKLPDFQNPCPISNLLKSPKRHQSWAARICGGARPCSCNPSLQQSPCLFICPSWSAAAPRRPICCPPPPPPARVGPGSSCRLISGQGEGGQAQTYSSKQSAVVRHQGNMPRFLLPSLAPQEFRVTSFPPGEDSTAVLLQGFPGPENLPRCSSASKGFALHRLPGKEQRSWEPAIPGSRSLLNVSKRPEGNPDAQERGWVKDFPVYQAHLPPPHCITWCLEV